MPLLKRTVDLVFKMLFVQSPRALKGMLSAILDEEIIELTILNPEIPGPIAGENPDKLIVLDLRVELKGGRRVIVEMQIRATGDLTSRLVFYAARDLSSALGRGEPYGDLSPTILIVWLGERIFPHDPSNLQRIFELRDRKTGKLLSDALSIHLLQLADLSGRATAQDSKATRALKRWAQFFTIDTEEELTELAKEDEAMAEAVETIKKLSEDPEAARAAQAREDAAIWYRISLAKAKKQGRQEGVEEGRAEGKAELFQTLLMGRFGALDQVSLGRLKTATSEDLDRWSARLLSAASLAQVFED